jgi:chromosome segregation ATPase
MDEWRAAGYAGKEYNDKLWEEFRAARDCFFTRRDEHYAELRTQQASVVEAKKQIIEEAKELTADVQNWVKTSDALNALMDRWKAAGNAGRDNEHALWEEFNGIRRDFRNRRKADLAERRNKERACAEAKRKIVDEARAIADSGNYVRENSDRMRQLSDEYKAAGYAGKPANDDLWKEFREAQNAYWAANSAARDQHRRERSERLQEAVERKSGQIEHLKDQNETLTTRLESTLNPEKVAQIKRWIAENEERLGGLKDDIDEIKKKI